MPRNKKQQKKKQEHQMLLQTAASTTTIESGTQCSAAEEPEDDCKKGCCESSEPAPPEEPKKTPQEKTQEYIESQMKVHNQFVERFDKEAECLYVDPEIEQKKEHWAKKEAEELKKLEKLIKKERNDFEDISSAGATNVKQVHDRVVKTLNQIRKINNQYYQVKQSMETYSQTSADNQKAVEGSLKKKEMLMKMCDAFLKKMSDLYLQHEVMLDEENKKRSEIAESFQDKMKGLSAELNTKKTERQAKFDRNQEVRNKIQNAIDEYKVKEEDYKGKMEMFNTEINDVQKNLQTELATGKTGKVMKDNEKEKDQFEKTMTRMKKTSDEIESFVAKFDGVKNEIEENNKKFGTLKMDIESKKLQIQLLETEIQNINVKNQLKEKTQQDVDEQRHQMMKQIETLTGLTSALEIQNAALQ